MFWKLNNRWLRPPALSCLGDERCSVASVSWRTDNMQIMARCREIRKELLMSPTFKKKPIVVEAWQFLEGQPLPPGVTIEDDGHGSVETARGNLMIKDRDWIIRDQIDGKYYPCDPEMFKGLFEALTENLTSEKDRQESFPTDMKCPLCKTNYVLTNRLHQQWCPWVDCKFGKADDASP